MKNEKVTKTFTIPVALTKLLCKHFNTANSSAAIYKGIAGFLSNTAYGKRMDDFALHQILSINERRSTKKYSVRILSELEQVFDRYTVGDTIYNIITIILANYLYYSGTVHAKTIPSGGNMLKLPEESRVDKSMCLVRLKGNKWSKLMQDAIKSICHTAIKDQWESSIEIFAGALGIFSNFAFASHEIINDIDLQKVNLYKAIQSSKEDMLIKLLSESVDEQTFENNKAKKKGFILDNKKVNIDAAVNYLFLNLLSVRNLGITFKRMAYEVYRNKMNAIYPLSERLKNTEICGLHALEILDKHKSDSSTVFIVDPPYLDTSGYENEILIDRKYDDDKKKFGYREHVELARLLREAHQKYGNDFIFFCRTTITRVKDQKTKDITNLGKLDTGDRHIQGIIDDLYWGYGFYYIDIPYDKDGTIERIITSFEFDGAIPYGA